MASSDQSVEVIHANCDSMTDCSDLFSNHFNEVLNSPDENWLMTPAGIEFTAPKAELKLPADFMKMTTTSDNRDFGADIKLINDVEKLTVAEVADTPANSKKRKVAARNEEEESKENAFEFESVIKSIQRSNNADWLTPEGKKYREAPRIEQFSFLTEVKPVESPLPTTQMDWLTDKKCSEDAPLTQDDWMTAKKHYESFIPVCQPMTILAPLQQTTTFSPASDCEQDVVSKQKHYWYPTMNSGQQTTIGGPDDHWLLKCPQTKEKTDRPTNQMAQNVATWESILGWQAILEKIHASGDDEWLVPASRVNAK